MKKAQKKGYKYEEKMGNKLGIHKGGPGKPDYITKNGLKGEIKATKRPVDGSTIKKEEKKGTKEIESKNGYTNEARKEGKKNKMILRKNGKKI